MTSRVQTGPAPPQRRDRQRLVYGDWTWLVRDGLDVLRLAFIGGTIAFAVMGRSTAVGLSAASALLLIARVIDLPRRFDLGLIVGATMIAWGTALGLYGDYHVYDNIVHSVTPVFYAPVLYIALVRLGVLADPQETRTPYHHLGVFVSTLAIGMAVEAGYEVVEWLSDTIAGTHYVKSIDDTGSDLLEGTLGSIVGGAFVALWSIRSWSTRRVAVGPTAAPVGPPLRLAIERLEAAHGGPVAPWAGRLAGLPEGLKGVVGIATGTLLLVWPSPALRTIEIVFGVAVIVHAALDVLEQVRSGTGHGLVRRVAEVVAELAVGTLLLAWPDISRLALFYAIGATSVALAFLEAASLSVAKSDRDRWLGGAASAAAFLYGVALLGFAGRSLDTTSALLGLYLVVLGVLRFVRASESRREPAAR
jgi:hypothetical protein